MKITILAAWVRVKSILATFSFQQVLMYCFLDVQCLITITDTELFLVFSVDRHPGEFSVDVACQTQAQEMGVTHFPAGCHLLGFYTCLLTDLAIQVSQCKGVDHRQSITQGCCALNVLCFIPRIQAEVCQGSQLGVSGESSHAMVTQPNW